MARQPKTRQPKAKFQTKCMVCDEMVVKRLIAGRLIQTCGCKR